MVLIINSMVIIVLTCILAYLVISQVELSSITGYINNGIDRINDKNEDRKLLREVKRHTRTISIKMTTAEKAELFLIDKSNIRRYIPFMNFYVLIIISVVVFGLTFAPVYEILRFVPSVVIICSVLSMIPYYILDIMGKYNSDKIRKRLSYFISVLLKWYAVKEDIFYAFEKSVDSGIGEPLKTYISDMAVQVKRGMDPIEALDILKLKVDNEQFRDFIINIKHCVRRKGNMHILLSNMEEQYYKLEEEFNRRNISTYSDRMWVVGVMAAVIGIAWYLLKTQPKVYQFYLGTIQGKMLLTLFTVMYALGCYLFISITKFKH